MPADRTAFAHSVLNAYMRGDLMLSKDARTSVEEAGGRPSQSMGHPAFTGLALNERDHCDAAAVFIDLRAFTARTFWDPPEQVVRLALAVLTQIVEVISDHGGHVLGLRGDGVFACFGGPDSQVPTVDVAHALAACAFSLDATQNVLNHLLDMSGIEPVQLRAGADYGRLDFVRTGTQEASEVNVLGFAPNFASKCEKIALSWEVVVGQGLADLIANEDLLTQHLKSPKRYERAGQVKNYSFYDLRWRSLLPHLPGLSEDLAGAPSSRVRIF